MLEFLQEALREASFRDKREGVLVDVYYDRDGVLLVEDGGCFVVDLVAGGEEGSRDDGVDFVGFVAVSGEEEVVGWCEDGGVDAEPQFCWEGEEVAAGGVVVRHVDG